MARRIPITFHRPQLAVKPSEACEMLRVSRYTLWRLIGRGSIRKTSYGTIPVSELERHLIKETV